MLFVIAPALQLKYFSLIKGNKNQRLEVITDIYWARPVTSLSVLYLLSGLRSLEIFLEIIRDKKLFYYLLN